jgi:hypothetical protein
MISHRHGAKADAADSRKRWNLRRARQGYGEAHQLRALEDLHKAADMMAAKRKLGQLISREEEK